MEVTHLPASTTPEEVARVLQRDGVAIVDELAGPAVMDRAREELTPFLEATRSGPDDFAGRHTKRTGGLIARSGTCRELIMHPLVVGSVGQVLSHVTNFQLHLTQVIAIGPGEIAQQIHRDQWAFDFFPFPKGYEVQCNTIWAMTEFTARNGATRVIPGSNHFDDKLQFIHDDTVPAEMAKGSVLFYTGSTYHGGGPNDSDTTRMGINITYNVAWLRQEENQYLTVPLEIARELPEGLQRMMGYAHGAYALGYVDDLRDPIEVIRPGAAKTGFGNLARAEEHMQNRR